MGLEWIVGEYVLVRCRGAGVHAGEIEAVEGEVVVLLRARRVWRWTGGLSCSELSQHGPGDGSRIAVQVPRQALRDWIELIPCTADARQRLERWTGAA